MKIICVGRNYINHAKELNNAIPTEPVIFMKPDSALLRKGEPFFLPDFNSEIHYEAELVFKIDKIGKHIQSQFVKRYISEVTLGIDFTARDLQEKQKQKGLPWEIAKAFDQSAVVGDWQMLDFDNIKNLEFYLLKNGTKVQQGFAKDMIFDIEKIVSYVSQYFTLKIGDLLFTGTPEGVGKVEIGDVLEGYLMGNKVFEVRVK